MVYLTLAGRTGAIERTLSSRASAPPPPVRRSGTLEMTAAREDVILGKLWYFSEGGDRQKR